MLNKCFCFTNNFILLHIFASFHYRYMFNFETLRYSLTFECNKNQNISSIKNNYNIHFFVNRWLVVNKITEKSLQKF